MKTLTMLLLLATAFISYASEQAPLHHLGLSEKSATYKLHNVNFEDIDALEGMWAKRGVALNGSITIVITGQGSNVVSCDFAYEVRRDEGRDDPEYIKNVIILRTALLGRFLTNTLGETLVNGEFASHIGSVLGMVREKWGNSWSAKFVDKILLIFSDSNRDVIHVTVMPSLLPGHFLQETSNIRISVGICT